MKKKALSVRTGIKAAGFCPMCVNHNRTFLK